MSTVINWCINKCEKDGFNETAKIAREELVKLQNLTVSVKEQKVEIKEVVPGYHYVPYYHDQIGNKCNLGDIRFDRESQSCSVRFYGWGVGIPLADLELILTEIRNLEERLQQRSDYKHW